MLHIYNNIWNMLSRKATHRSWPLVLLSLKNMLLKLLIQQMISGKMMRLKQVLIQILPLPEISINPPHPPIFIFLKLFSWIMPIIYWIIHTTSNEIILFILHDKTYGKKTTTCAKCWIFSSQHNDEPLQIFTTQQSN